MRFLNWIVILFIIASIGRLIEAGNLPIWQWIVLGLVGLWILLAYLRKPTPEDERWLDEQRRKIREGK